MSFLRTFQGQRIAASWLFVQLRARFDGLLTCPVQRNSLACNRRPSRSIQRKDAKTQRRKDAKKTQLVYPELEVLPLFLCVLAPWR